MELNGIISSVMAMKRLNVQLTASTMVAKKAIDAQKVAGETLIKMMQQSALQTGKGINIDIIG